MPGFGQTMGGNPPQTQLTDVRTGYQRANEMRNQQMGDMLAKRYQASLTDPNFALGDPGLQAIQMNELVDKTAGGLGERGISGGAAKAQLAKTIADWKLGQMDMQRQERDKLRMGAQQAYGQTGTQMGSQQLPGSPGLLQQVGNPMIAKLGDKAMDPNTYSGMQWPWQSRGEAPKTNIPESNSGGMDVGLSMGGT